MIVLLTCWLILIAVWGVSERWDAAVVWQRVERGLRSLRHSHATHPFDWEDL